MVNQVFEQLEKSSVRILTQLSTRDEVVKSYLDELLSKASAQELAQIYNQFAVEKASPFFDYLLGELLKHPEAVNALLAIQTEFIECQNQIEQAWKSVIKVNRNPTYSAEYFELLHFVEENVSGYRTWHESFLRNNAVTATLK